MEEYWTDCSCGFWNLAGLRSSSKFIIFVVCNLWYNAWEIYLFDRKLWFCHSRVICQVPERTRTRNWYNWKNELDSHDTVQALRCIKKLTSSRGCPSLKVSYTGFPTPSDISRSALFFLQRREEKKWVNFALPTSWRQQQTQKLILKPTD